MSMKTIKLTHWELELIRGMIQEEQDRWFEEDGMKVSRRMIKISKLVEKLQ